MKPLPSLLAVAAFVVGLSALVLLGYMAHVTRTQADTIAQLNNRVDQLNTAVDHQTAVLHRSLGKYIPIQVPEATETKLREFEHRIADKERWPSSETEAEKWRSEVDYFVKQNVPPWTEEELLPRLNAVRWAVHALALTCKVVPDDQAAETGEVIHSLFVAAPESANKELKAYLQGREAELTRVSQRHSRDTSLDMARCALECNGDCMRALRGLEGVQDGEANELRGQLRKRLLDQDTERKLAVLQVSLKATTLLPSEQLRQSALLKVQDSAASVLLDLHSEDAPQRANMIAKVTECVQKCEAQFRVVIVKQQEAREQKVREYQKWALANIQDFDGPNRWKYDETLSWIQNQLSSFKNPTQDLEKWPLFETFPSTKELLENSLGINLAGVKGAAVTVDQQKMIYQAAWSTIGWKGNIDQEIAYRVTRDGMVIFLLPINPGLLDPPVAQLYQKAFQRAWNKLEGRADQLYVAQQTAFVKKKFLD